MKISTLIAAYQPVNHATLHKQPVLVSVNVSRAFRHLRFAPFGFLAERRERRERRKRRKRRLDLFPKGGLVVGISSIGFTRLYQYM